MAQTPKQKFLDTKFKEIKTMGVRRNTRAPVSASNPRRAVLHQQAVAIALSEARRKGL